MFSGNTVIGTAELQRLVADQLGHALAFGQMQQLAQHVTDHYRQAGYLLARAYLPQQSLKDGLLEIDVLEGRISNVKIDNHSSLMNSRAQAFGQGLADGHPLKADELERQLLLMNDLPGVEVRSTLRPGASVGTSQLDIELDRTRAFAGSIGVANDGNRYTGTTRADAALTLNDPIGLGDALTLRVLGAGRDFAYGRLAWQFPLGSDGWQFGVAGSDMHYRLAEDFKALDASGRAQVLGGYAVYPLLRSRLDNINLQLAFDHKQFADLIGAANTRTDKHTDVLALGLSGSAVDRLFGGGATQWSSSLALGRLSLDPTAARLDASGHDTAGRYARLTLQGDRTQQLGGIHQLHLQGQVQWASRNLDSSEKLGLTGSQAVRGYREGLVSVDQGVVVNAEWQQNWTEHWQTALFGDAAWGSLNDHPLVTDGRNSTSLSALGLATNYAGKRVYARLSLARRTGHAVSDSNALQGWARLSYAF